MKPINLPAPNLAVPSFRSAFTASRERSPVRDHRGGGVFLFPSLAAALTLLAAPSSRAATYYTSATADLVNDFTILNSGGSLYFRASRNIPLATTFTAGQGDKVFATITFANDQALRLFADPSGNEYIDASISAVVVGSHATRASGLIGFSGVTGSLLLNPLMTPISEGFGNTVHSPALMTTANLTDSSFAFTGLTLEIDIDSMLNEPSPYTEVTGLFESTWLQFRGGGFEVVGVPEPATSVLAAISALVFFTRRRRS